jgi:hypothetical protein
MRCTELTLIPLCFAILAAVQCVASPGGSPSARTTMPSGTSAPNGSIRDRRVLSRNKPSKPSFHETLLPAPDTGLGLAGLTHDRVAARTIGRKQND